MPRRNRNVAPSPIRFEPAGPSRPRARTSVGQHYLADGSVLQRIAESVELVPEDVVIEVGPGPGPLTKRLVKTYAKVIGAEIDERFRENLKHLQRNHPNLSVVWGDVLKMDFEELWGDTPIEHRVLVGNIPYQITSPLLGKMCEVRTAFSRAVILMQREVADRLVAEPGSKARSALSAKLQLDFEMKLLFGVNRKAFKPAPKVQSGVVHFAPLAAPLVGSEEERSRVRKIIEAAFGARRQMVVNSLARRYGPALPKGEWIEMLISLGIDPKQRGETLSTADFVGLGKLVSEAEKTLAQED